MRSVRPRCRTVALVACVVACACRSESRPPASGPVEPPVSDPSGIPDAPVSGTLGGAPFTLRDARYVADRRPGYEHTDLLLSAGHSESPCGDVTPSTSTSVWLRLDGPAPIPGGVIRVNGAHDERGAWSVHYQRHDGARWTGVGDASALVSLDPPRTDGRVTGALAVCFADGSPPSCVSGSFDARACPPRIDAPVRGAVRPGAMTAAPHEAHAP